MNLLIPSIAAVAAVALFAIKRMSLVSEERARKLLRQGALVIDVRTPKEFSESRVADALNIPLSDLAASLPQHVEDKNQALLVHCLSGGRSNLARLELKDMGYTNVFNLGSLARAKKIKANSARVAHS